MSPIRATTEVFDAIQRAKTGATAFTTNFFPNLQKLEDWINRRELFVEASQRTALFLRQDRDFWHLYFSAANEGELEKAVIALPALRTERLAVDLIGVKRTIQPMLSVLELVGFRRYKNLYRMARPAGPAPAQTACTDYRIDFARRADSELLLDLISQSFDRYAEQLPTLSEIQMATEARQILSARRDTAIAGLLFFEDHGFTSTIRYWLVSPSFRQAGFGSALMSSYLKRPTSVRRFILWVLADNNHAIAKYHQHGFAADGLLDYVLTNEMISP